MKLFVNYENNAEKFWAWIQDHANDLPRQVREILDDDESSEFSPDELPAILAFLEEVPGWEDGNPPVLVINH